MLWVKGVSIEKITFSPVEHITGMSGGYLTLSGSKEFLDFIYNKEDVSV